MYRYEFMEARLIQIDRRIFKDIVCLHFTFHVKKLVIPFSYIIFSNIIFKLIKFHFLYSSLKWHDTEECGWNVFTWIIIADSKNILSLSFISESCFALVFKALRNSEEFLNSAEMYLEQNLNLKHFVVLNTKNIYLCRR